MVYVHSSHRAERQRVTVSIGDPIHDGDGAKLGTIRGVDENGSYVRADEHVDAPTPSVTSTGGSAGEIDLRWRC